MFYFSIREDGTEMLVVECIQYNGTVMVLLWWCEWWVGGRTVVDGMDTVLREKIHTLNTALLAFIIFTK